MREPGPVGWRADSEEAADRGARPGRAHGPGRCGRPLRRRAGRPHGPGRRLRAGQRGRASGRPRPRRAASRPGPAPALRGGRPADHPLVRRGAAAHRVACLPVDQPRGDDAGRGHPAVGRAGRRRCRGARPHVASPRGSPGDGRGAHRRGLGRAERGRTATPRGSTSEWDASTGRWSRHCARPAAEACSTRRRTRRRPGGPTWRSNPRSSRCGRASTSRSGSSDETRCARPTPSTASCTCSIVLWPRAAGCRRMPRLETSCGSWATTRSRSATPTARFSTCRASDRRPAR